MTFLYLVVALILILLNAFFVLAEFAIVRVRTTKIDVLIEKGSPVAKLLKHIHNHIDEYLSVCQIGITFASIGLGFVGEPSFARIFSYILTLFGIHNIYVVHSLAIATAYFTISFLHILLGELVPKSIAVRKPDKMALFSAYPLQFFRMLFLVPLFILNNCAMAILYLLGFSSKNYLEPFAKDEIKIILKSSHSTGMISFPRLLMMENIFDLGNLKVKDAMKPKSHIKVLDTSLSWEENMNIIRESKYSRYPLIDGNINVPAGIVHIKDIIFNNIPDSPSSSYLKKIARAYITVTPDTFLEKLLTQFQKFRRHVGIVVDEKNHWIGMVTLEDIIEEIIGSVEDEFEKDVLPFLSEIITLDRILLDLKSDNFQSVIKEMLLFINKEDLNVQVEKVFIEIMKREKIIDSCMGKNMAVPHARIDGLKKPVIIFGRSIKGVRVAGKNEMIHLFFVVLTPLSLPLYQPKLISKICALASSEYVYEKLMEATTPQEIIEIIKTADPLSIS